MFNKPKFDPSKPCKTKDGKDAKFLRKTDSFVHPYVFIVNGNAEFYTINGKYFSDHRGHRLDLTNVEEDE